MGATRDPPGSLPTLCISIHLDGRGKTPKAMFVYLVVMIPCLVPMVVLVCLSRLSRS